MTKRYRAVFMGTPEFAVPSLEALCELTDVTAVVTQPDRPSGRGMKLTAPPVKQCALVLGIEVVQPTKVRTPDFLAWFSAQAPDVALVAAYGRILPLPILQTPRFGCLNVHGSLLPRWRGAAPVAHAIMAGDPKSGVGLMQMEEGLDTGPVWAERETFIDPNETAGQLMMRLSVLGQNLVRESLLPCLEGKLQARTQDPSHVTVAGMLTKEAGLIDWSCSAQDIHNQVRGLSPWPGAYTFLNGMRLKCQRTFVHHLEGQYGACGQLIQLDSQGWGVACGQGILGLHTVQAEGKQALDIHTFVVGYRLQSGFLLG